MVMQYQATLNKRSLSLFGILIKMERFENYPFKVEFLLKFGTDLTGNAKLGKLDPVIGREREIERLTQVLCKRRKNNACLIGDPGVGKTVIVEGLANSIANRFAPRKLADKKIFAVDMARIIAGASNRGDFEERLLQLVDEVKNSRGSVIVFIDELHTVVGAGGGTSALDAANILKPAIARGEFKCIGATTLEEYRKFIEKDSALKRRFSSIDVPEPSRDEAIEILNSLKAKYESHHGVIYSRSSLIAAVDLSKQYLSDLFLPDKAIDLIDEAGSRVSIRSTKEPNTSSALYVTVDDIEQVVSMLTGIPLNKLSNEESLRLLEMEKTLRRSLIGQDEAVSVVSKCICRARVGLRDESKPIACFLFTGPTGVGKTELAKLLSKEYFGSKEAMVRLDMSEYMESHNVARLYGSPPGFGHEEGGLLTEAIRTRPHSLILFDEIEKAHPQVFNALLQILDDGRLTDGKGKLVDFKNTIITMTSNIGGNLRSEAESGAKLKEFFKPEFLNRLDEIVVFKPLKMVHMRQILDAMLIEFYERVEKKKNICVEIGSGLKYKLVDEVYNATYGARPLKRAFTRLVEDNFAEKMLNGSLASGQRVSMDVDSDDEVMIYSSINYG